MLAYYLLVVIFLFVISFCQAEESMDVDEPSQGTSRSQAVSHPALAPEKTVATSITDVRYVFNL